MLPIFLKKPYVCPFYVRYLAGIIEHIHLYSFTYTYLSQNIYIARCSEVLLLLYICVHYRDLVYLTYIPILIICFAKISSRLSRIWRMAFGYSALPSGNGKILILFTKQQKGLRRIIDNIQGTKINVKIFEKNLSGAIFLFR